MGMRILYLFKDRNLRNMLFVEGNVITCRSGLSLLNQDFF